jgi:uncharacterized membrane protein YgdD (TMEM256/DUF423 family)
MNRTSLLFGSGMIMLGIILGAFGAHALKEVLESEELMSFEVGVRYQMYHGLALLLLGALGNNFSFVPKWVATCMIIGVVLFSGSIYLLSIDRLLGIELKMLVPVTPIGGAFLIMAWGAFFWQVLRFSSKKD